jgi:NAD(P)-dependent dehydrogenase (short-subunit alcohol dehydrogenase family)
MNEQTRSPRNVLITGAAHRIGRAIALGFAAEGWSVGIHCHASAAAAADLARDIAEIGGNACVLQADLADADQLETLIPRCIAAIGAPACLVNNASTFHYDALPSLESQQWDRQLAVNLKAPVFLAKAFALHLPSAETGNIINILDQRVLKPTPHFFSYAVSKAALWSATETMAQALAPRIRVNAIGPGPAMPSVHQTAEQFAQQSAATPLQRGTTPAEIVAAIRFILDAPALTGQMIALDGGQHLAWQTPDVLAASDKG